MSASGMAEASEREALSCMAASPLFSEQNVPMSRIFGMEVRLAWNGWTTGQERPL